MTYSVVVPGPPCAKGRPRFTRKGFPYTPEKTRRAEQRIGDLFSEKYQGHALLGGPLEVDIIATFAIPQSASKKKAHEMRGQIIMPTKRPDADNLAKMCDALNGIAWHDDKQIVDLHVLKIYGTKPSLEFKIRPFGEEP